MTFSLDEASTGFADAPDPTGTNYYLLLGVMLTDIAARVRTLMPTHYT